MGSISLSNKVGKLSKEGLLQRANEFIFSSGLNDGASKLCKANMKYGLAQFHLIQEKYGFLIVLYMEGYCPSFWP